MQYRYGFQRWHVAAYQASMRQPVTAADSGEGTLGPTCVSPRDCQLEAIPAANGRWRWRMCGSGDLHWTAW